MKYDRIKNLGRYAKRGTIPWNKGISHSEETKRKIGLANKGNKAHLGYKHSEEAKKIMSEIAKKRMVHPFLGKKHTETSKNKMRKARMKQIFPKKMTSIELQAKELLDNLHIPYKMHKPIMNITQPDFFIEPNICIYCDGEYWHSLLKVIERDKKINSILEYAGYKVIRLKEQNRKLDLIELGRAVNFARSLS